MFIFDKQIQKQIGTPANSVSSSLNFEIPNHADNRYMHLCKGALMNANPLKQAVFPLMRYAKIVFGQKHGTSFLRSKHAGNGDDMVIMMVMVMVMMRMRRQLLEEGRL